MDKNELAKLVTAAQNGNKDALEKLYLKNAKKVYYLALKMTKNAEDAEDITQEVFITVFEKIGGLKDPSMFGSWLNRITANKCTDIFRKRGKLVQEDTEDISEADFSEEADPLLIPENALDNAETARMIVEVIDSLPDPQRMCVYYYYYEQLTIAQIAEILITNENAVKQRLYLAREKIRRELERLNKEEGIKLYAVPLMLTPILKMPLQDFEMPQGLLQGLWGEITAATAGTASAAASSVSSAAAAAKGAAVTGIKAKIAMTAAGIVIAGGITTGVILTVNSDDSLPADVTISEEAVTESIETTEAANVYETPDENPRGANSETELDLSYQGLTDISFLSDYQHLEILKLQGNEISDISALVGLTGLKSLNLDGNNISDISPLSELTELEYLNLNFNNIVDISVLEELTNLKDLQLHANKINDISALSELIGLVTLDLNGSEISEINALSELTNLITLDLDKNEIIDISSLSKMTNLTRLDLCDNRITDISVLAELTNLENLALISNNISDISVLSKLTNLKSLALSSNNIKNINIVSGLTNLEILFLDNNKIDSLDFLKELINLKILFLSRNNINDISVLLELTALEELDLSDNEISDIGALAELTKLERLIIRKHGDGTSNPLITQKDVDYLKATLPDCDIDFE